MQLEFQGSRTSATPNACTCLWYHMEESTLSCILAHKCFRNPFGPQANKVVFCLNSYGYHRKRRRNLRQCVWDDGLNIYVTDVNVIQCYALVFMVVGDKWTRWPRCSHESYHQAHVGCRWQSTLSEFWQRTGCNYVQPCVAPFRLVSTVACDHLKLGPGCFKPILALAGYPTAQSSWCVPLLSSHHKS